MKNYGSQFLSESPFPVNKTGSGTWQHKEKKVTWKMIRPGFWRANQGDQIKYIHKNWWKSSKIGRKLGLQDAGPFESKETAMDYPM